MIPKSWYPTLNHLFNAIFIKMTEYKSNNYVEDHTVSSRHQYSI